MASIYKRPNSPFWWIKYRSATGKTIRESTRFFHGIPRDTKRARELCAHRTIKELQTRGGSERERWECWVTDYLNMRYERSPKSLQRYSIAWRNLFAYFSVKHLPYPSQIAYTDCIDYLNWRKKGDSAAGVHQAHHNTARFDLKLLHLLMNEAIRRGYASGNPAARLGIERRPPDEKPEIPDADIATIRAALVDEPEWMRVAFEIGLYTGCRLRDTRIALDCADTERRTIYFATPRKGRPAFTAPMHEALVPIFRQLRTEGRTHTLEMPQMPSKHWWVFFRRIGLPRYCFHCLRVTFITRGARAGVGEREMMRLVNHASTTIHRVYQRLTVEDVRQSLAAIPLPQQSANETAQSLGDQKATSWHRAR